MTGRVDDVVNVSGHRLGTAEVESALVAHEMVSEAAVVGFPHDMKGTAIYAFVVPVAAFPEEQADELVGALKEAVRHSIGAIAVPERILPVAGLPKTRSGKIMRRILRNIAAGEYAATGDTSTLADPGVVDQVVAAHRLRFEPEED